MKTKIILLLLINSVLLSCNTDDEVDEILNNLTIAVIKTVNIDDNTLSNIKVYAYLENNWLENGDDTTKADRNFTTTNTGLASFSINYIPNTFTSNHQEKIYFSAHYVLDGINKTKFVSLILKKGNRKNTTLILD